MVNRKSLCAAIFPRKHKRNTGIKCGIKGLQFESHVWKQTRKAAQSVPLPFNVVKWNKMVIKATKNRFRGQISYRFLSYRSSLFSFESSSGHISVDIIIYELMKSTEGPFFFVCLFVFSILWQSYLSRGWRKVKHWGNHFGVHGSCSHVPLAHADPLHPQVKEGEAAQFLCSSQNLSL